jgi:hypothetical protein
MKRKLITIVTERGRITTNMYTTRGAAIAGTGAKNVWSVTVRPLTVPHP